MFAERPVNGNNRRNQAGVWALRGTDYAFRSLYGIPAKTVPYFGTRVRSKILAATARPATRKIARRTRHDDDN